MRAINAALGIKGQSLIYRIYSFNMQWQLVFFVTVILLHTNANIISTVDESITATTAANLKQDIGKTVETTTTRKELSEPVKEERLPAAAAASKISTPCFGIAYLLSGKCQESATNRNGAQEMARFHSKPIYAASPYVTGYPQTQHNPYGQPAYPNYGAPNYGSPYGYGYGYPNNYAQYPPVFNPNNIATIVTPNGNITIIGGYSTGFPGQFSGFPNTIFG